VSQGDPKTVIQDPVVVEAYLGRKFAERQMKLAHG
jgi:ABC-type lipopolysaccharide export system ATPase subunit